MAEGMHGGRIALIGCGKMGQAILHGWLDSKSGPAAELSPSNFVVVEPSEQHAEALRQQYSVQVVSSVENLFDMRMVVLAVKPQVVPEVLPGLAAVLADSTSEPLVVSIAAGVTTASLSDALPSGTRIVRVMPNMPLQVGRGATVVAGGSNATEQDIKLVQELFAALGFSAIVDEKDIDAVCAISGGGPAYFAAMLEVLTAAGVEQGLDAQLAQKLALETMGGTYACLTETDVSPEELRVSVCSPGGTTLAALGAMEEHGFKESISAGMNAAVKRAKELARC